MAHRTIGKVAAETGVNVETVRYYERIGILRRPPARSGGRVYGDEAVWLIRYVKVAQSWGMSLKTIIDLLRKAEQSPNFCAAVRAAASDKIEAIDQLTMELARQRKELVEFIDACAAKPDSERCPVYKRLSGIPN
jgi:MerR family mercuric resistance operon transcriptional regulator